ncbi:MAG: VWA domain-containing protein [Blautia sp.]|nr:VWA domain-containing protein [Blautia sp.]
MGNQFHKADSDKYKNGNVTLYQVYNESDNGKTRKDYLEASISGTNETLSDILDILSLARNSNQDPDVLIAWNTFCNQLVDGQGRSRTFTSAKNPIALNYAYNGGTSTDIALLDAAGYRCKDFNNRFSSYERTHDNVDYWWETTAEYNNNVRNHGIDRLGQNDCVYVDMVGKGTQSYETGANAYGFDWDTNPSTPKYTVLITDGAPQRGGQDIDDRFIKDAAELLKRRGVTLITVGLSMGNVDKGRVLLYDIASKDASNDPYFYAANSGDELEYVLYSIIRSILQDCYVYGNVTDTVGEAFYPVDKETGKPLVDGDWIQLSGELIPASQRSTWIEPYGVIDKSGDTYTVTWTYQKFGPLDKNKWHGAVFVKAKEDFLGGDVVKTNKGNARIEAKSYTVGEGTSEIQLASQRQDVTVVINGQTVTSHYDPVVDDLPSPRVNVNELDITQNDSGWTVYGQYNSDEDDPAELSHLNDLDYPGSINIKLVKNHDIEPHEAGKLGTPAESYTLTVIFAPDYESCRLARRATAWSITTRATIVLACRARQLEQTPARTGTTSMSSVGCLKSRRPTTRAMS